MPVLRARAIQIYRFHLSASGRLSNVNRHQLRELAGMTTNESLASPELSETMRAIAKENENVTRLSGHVDGIRGANRKMNMTAAGSAKISRTMKATNDRLTAEQRSERQSEFARQQSKESRAKQAASLAAYHAAKKAAQ